MVYIPAIPHVTWGLGGAFCLHHCKMFSTALSHSRVLSTNPAWWVLVGQTCIRLEIYNTQVIWHLDLVGHNADVINTQWLFFAIFIKVISIIFWPTWTHFTNLFTRLMTQTYQIHVHHLLIGIYDGIKSTQSKTRLSNEVSSRGIRRKHPRVR